MEGRPGEVWFAILRVLLPLSYWLGNRARDMVGNGRRKAMICLSRDPCSSKNPLPMMPVKVRTTSEIFFQRVDLVHENPIVFLRLEPLLWEEGCLPS